MRVHIELDQCEGHGLCAATAPDLYDLDDDGFAAKADFEVPDELIADNSAILAALPWRPAHADLDGIVRDALAWERVLAERQA